MPGFGVVPFDPVDQVLALIQAIDMASQADEIGFLLLIEAWAGWSGGLVTVSMGQTFCLGEGCGFCWVR